MVNLYTGLEKVDKGNRESLLNALSILSEFDADFNGENGIDYLWSGVNPDKFYSNMEYLISKVKNIKSDEECIQKFFKEWMEHYNYAAYKYNTITEDNNVIAVGFSAALEY